MEPIPKEEPKCFRISYEEVQIQEFVGMINREELDWEECSFIFFIQEGDTPSEFEDIINYLLRGEYPKDLSQEKKSVFQYKVRLFTLFKGILFCLGADEVLRRCVHGAMQTRIITSLHTEQSGAILASRVPTGRYWIRAIGGPPFGGM